jgi:molybdopterin-guanine dinucleotide biosynthesis protein A
VTHANLSAAVLAGGSSRRMGVDKALMRFAGSTMIERVLTILFAVSHDVMIVGDRPEYHKFGTRMVADIWPGAGALGGIASALCSARSSHVLCVACDMPLLSQPLLRAMADEPRDYDVLALVTAHRDDETPVSEVVHPLHAIYSRDALPLIEKRIRAGSLRAEDAVRALNARFLQAEWIRRFDPTFQSLTNVNTPADLQAALRKSGASLQRPGKHA